MLRGVPSSTQRRQPKIVLTIGPSYAGKSSFINTLAKESRAEVSNGNGMSTTIQIRPFNITAQTPLNREHLIIFDVPGFHDSRQCITNKQIKKEVEETILEIGESEYLSTILIFESLAAEPISLNTTLTSVETMLGPSFKKSALVVFTKEDLSVYEDEREARKKTLEDICRKHYLPFIYWKNDLRNIKIDQSTYESQVDELLGDMKVISPYYLSEIEAMKQRINKRALELEATTPKTKQMKEVEIQTTTMEQYTETVMRVRSIPEIVVGPRRGWFKHRKRWIVERQEYYPVKEVKYREVPITKKVLQEFEVPFPPEYFYELAKKDFIKKLRQFNSQ